MTPVSSWSQFGEDLLVWELFGRSNDGVFVEIGAHHPTHLSQTYLLETQGWRGMLVEPQPRLTTLLRKERPRSVVFEYAVVEPGREGEAYLVVPSQSGAAAYLTFEKPASGDYETVPTATVDQLLLRSGLDRVDFLSLDIEGLELQALRGFDLARYQPKLILMEDHLYTLAKHRYLVANHYRLVNRIGYNQWYIPAHHPFPLRPSVGSLELFRKMYLSLPFRRLKRILKGEPYR